ncbi:MAG: MlaD family protein [bacterium]
MSRFKTEFWVGLFTIAGAVLALYMVARTGDLRFERREGYRLQATFRDVSGLDVGDTVRIAGVYVGEVRDIRLEDAVGKVTLSILPRVVVHEDASARVGTYGLLGDRYVSIDPGSPELPPLGPGDEIRNTQVPESMDVFFDRLNQVAGQVEQVTDNLSKVLGGPEGEKAMREIVTNTQEVSRDLARMTRENQAQIREITTNLAGLTRQLDGIVAENREAIRKTIAVMPETAESLRGVAREANDLLKNNRQNISDTIEQLRVASVRLNASLENIDLISRKVKEGEGTLGKLVQDQGLYDDARNTLVEMRNLIEDLREQAPISAFTAVGGAAF